MRYEVTIEAVIRKTYTVEAEDTGKAMEEAQGLFSVLPEGDEYYSQDVLKVCEADVSDESRSYGPHHKTM